MFILPKFHAFAETIIAIQRGYRLVLDGDYYTDAQCEAMVMCGNDRLRDIDLATVQ